ncbi:threonine--tRNA ligase [Rickettsiales endosymbiont of Peranema trichophorum]|uniref:threonine--tRNA ligase n=1 Tax=Rickettsiales endosymbiont of Peranema trichophorum TaxID=2486577 RepID=UPI0010232200|nr:threonine--tRNA ligase [Rickettsiales endosymbiont of Peranema trichophorum]RZI46970.1 threonine--tRNA ligase [Rickettsiales endosymbiont of Peranema trichophorum]
MIQITLKDQTVKTYAAPVNGMDIASSISPSLAKKVVASKVNGQLQDFRQPIATDATVELITVDSQEGLEILRHDSAHVLAQAVKELFPTTQLVIGPTIENAFYYDFATSHHFTPEDLKSIEEKMKEIVKLNLPFHFSTMSKDEAIDYFLTVGEQYKVEIIRNIPETHVTIYSQGNFVDLCRGPHGQSTGMLKAFKLMKTSGSYWRGDSKNQPLQRIYGTAWATQQQLEEYLHYLQEIEKRDHRKIGKAMNLFHFQEEAPGFVFWHTKGWTLFQTLLNHIRNAQRDYLEVNTPELLYQSLWETSGHWEKFKDNMFIATVMGEDKHCALKPMSCPGAVQLFKHLSPSYKDLPIRLAEFGKVFRYEPSGALHGLFRLRGFTQDDAHIFCTEEQVQSECYKMSHLILQVYRDFGFDNVSLKLADRPQNRIGTDEIWDKAEHALQQAIIDIGLPYTVNSGEGAFYGPKIEFVLKDAIGRDWQLGTIQVDFNLPQRFDAHYTSHEGLKRHPIMIHRAMLGSIERFIGMVLEHHMSVPLPFAPVQVVIATITNTSEIADYASHVQTLVNQSGIRTELDLSSETINYKIRKHMVAKVPIVAVLGQKELQNQSVSLRILGKESQETLDLQDFIRKLKKDITMHQ